MERILLLIRTFLLPSQINGLGCFAAEAIKKGDAVWKFDARTDFIVLTDDVANLPIAAQKFIDGHAFVASDGDLVCCIDNAAYVNHSTDPNIAGGDWESIATRDIAAGEEITEDYRTYGDGACRSFLDQL